MNLIETPIDVLNESVDFLQRQVFERRNADHFTISNMPLASFAQTWL